MAQKAGEANKEMLRLIMLSHGPVVQELIFHPTRKWRFDYALPDLKLAVEYQGHSGFVRSKKGQSSGHSSVTGLTNDCEKFNQAKLHGWTVLCFTALHFKEKDRVNHKLTSPVEMIGQMVQKLKNESKIPRM